MSLEQVQRLHSRPFHPRRQVAGPLPYITSARAPLAARAPHLTVPPYQIAPPEIRADLSRETPKAEGERFRRFRAQVEMTTEQPLDEDAPGGRNTLPATVALPLHNPPSLWQRLVRLFTAG